MVVRPPVIAGLTVATVAVIAAVLWQSHNQDVANARLSKRIASLESGLAQPRDVVSPSVQYVLEPGPAAMAPAAPVTSATVAQNAGASAAAPRPAPSAEEAMMVCERSFYGENTDAAWAPRARSDLDSDLRPLLSGHSSVNSFDCHSSMCRLEAVYPSSQDYRQFGRGLRSPDRAWSGGYIFSTVEETLASGAVRAVTYFGRGGTQPPFQD
jgi:hypothetical protein